MFRPLFFLLLLSSLSCAAVQATPPTIRYDDVSYPSIPYVFSLESARGQKLEYVGTCHDNDPTHLQYAILKKRFEKFLRNIDLTKTAVIIEMPDSLIPTLARQISTTQSNAILSQNRSTSLPSNLSSKDLLVNAQSEVTEKIIDTHEDPGYAAFLASENAISVVGGELTHKQVIEALSKDFDHNLVLYFCFVQALDFWNRSTKKSTLTERSSLGGRSTENLTLFQTLDFWKTTLTSDQIENQAGDFEQKPTSNPLLESYVVDQVRSWTNTTTVTFNDLTELHQSYANMTFRLDDTKLFSQLMDISNYGIPERHLVFWGKEYELANLFFRLLERTHQIRDSYTLDIIRKEWSAGKNLFIVYGALHAVVLKKSLEHLTKLR